MMRIESFEVDHVVVLKFVGSQLIAGDVSAVKEQFSSLARPNRNYVFEMGDLEFLDSLGLGVLIACLKLARSNGGDIALCGISTPVYRIFELVKLHRVFHIYDILDAALSSFHHPLPTTPA